MVRKILSVCASRSHRRWVEVGLHSFLTSLQNSSDGRVYVLAVQPPQRKKKNTDAQWIEYLYVLEKKKFSYQQWKRSSEIEQCTD